jgi:hypothetical protein
VAAVIQVAVRAGLAYTALRDMVFSHPTMAEGLNDLFARLEQHLGADDASRPCRRDRHRPGVRDDRHPTCAGPAG